MAIASLSIIASAALCPFAQIQVAAQQQQSNVNNNNNPPKLSLSAIPSAVGTGADVTGAIVTVPGFIQDKKPVNMFEHIFVKNP
jgi:alcohol dehydrogenase class IV